MDAPGSYDEFETRYLATDGRNYGNDQGQWGPSSDATFFQTPEEAQRVADEFRDLWYRYTGMLETTYVLEVRIFQRPYKKEGEP